MHHPDVSLVDEPSEEIWSLLIREGDKVEALHTTVQGKKIVKRTVEVIEDLIIGMETHKNERNVSVQVSKVEVLFAVSLPEEIIVGSENGGVIFLEDKQVLNQLSFELLYHF